MSRINTGRVVLAGLAAGVVMNVVDAVANGVLLGNAWRTETTALNAALMDKAAAGSTVGWIAVDLLLGITLVWLYAAIRPRFGPGPRTAALAAVVLWIATHLVYGSYVFMGLYSSSLIGASSLAGLVAVLAGGYVGGKLYREEPAAAGTPAAAAA
jgi:hypothetical protein